MSQATEQNATQRMSGREAALARRRAMSLGGKSAIAAGASSSAASSAPPAKAAPAPVVHQQPAEIPAAAQATTEAHVCNCQQRAAEPVAAPIQPAPVSEARKRRMERSLIGRGNAPTARPTGRVRPAPAKVETGTTLSGSEVTGTQVERTSRVTGNEPGSCRAVTGTEYIGAEQYSSFCASVPNPAPAKVATTSTSRGRSVTGTEVGRSSRVTGDENGTCKRVTGTEYLSAEQASQFCGTTAEPAPEKVIMGRTMGRNPLTGDDGARANRVTGGEAGVASRITGGIYANPVVQRPQDNSSKKALTSHPSVGSAVRSTLPVRSPSPISAEAQASSRVTGSRYLTDSPFVAQRRERPYQPPVMQGATRTLAGDQVTGMVMAMPSRMTGDEYRAKKPVTGTSSIAVEHLVERDVAEAPVLRLVDAGFVHRRATAPQEPKRTINNLMQQAEPDMPVASGQFSMQQPAMASMERRETRITGNAWGGGSRISGSMARATGLISGTPEFRYRDDVMPVQAVAEIRPETPAEPTSQPATTGRITGEGRERLITGDAWDRGDRVTGTEGQSTNRRNPTMRGLPPVMRPPRPVEKPEASDIRITGGSGNTKGAAVTLSGGARG